MHLRRVGPPRVPFWVFQVFSGVVLLLGDLQVPLPVAVVLHCQWQVQVHVIFCQWGPRGTCHWHCQWQCLGQWVFQLELEVCRDDSDFKLEVHSKDQLKFHQLELEVFAVHCVLQPE